MTALVMKLNRAQKRLVRESLGIKTKNFTRDVTRKFKLPNTKGNVEFIYNTVWNKLQVVLDVKKKGQTKITAVNKKELVNEIKRNTAIKSVKKEADDDSGLGTGAIVGIVIGAIVVLVLIIGIIFYCKGKGKKDTS